MVEKGRGGHRPDGNNRQNSARTINFLLQDITLYFFILYILLPYSRLKKYNKGQNY